MKRGGYTQKMKKFGCKKLLYVQNFCYLTTYQENSKKIHQNKKEILQEMMFKCLAIKNLIKRNKKKQFKKWKETNQLEEVRNEKLTQHTDKNNR